VPILTVLLLPETVVHTYPRRSRCVLNYAARTAGESTMSTSKCLYESVQLWLLSHPKQTTILLASDRYQHARFASQHLFEPSEECNDPRPFPLLREAAGQGCCDGSAPVIYPRPRLADFAYKHSPLVQRRTAVEDRPSFLHGRFSSFRVNDAVVLLGGPSSDFERNPPPLLHTPIIWSVRSPALQVA